MLVVVPPLASQRDLQGRERHGLPAPFLRSGGVDIPGERADA